MASQLTPESTVAPMQKHAKPLLSVRNLRTSFFQDEGTTKAVDGATFDVMPGKTLGIVGESGCGKSITAQSILRIVDHPGRIVEGEIILTRADGSEVDLVKLKPDGREIRAIRGGDIGLVFQEPMTSFSPVHTVGAQIVEAVLLHNAVGKKEARRRGIEALRSVGIPNPERRIDEYSFELSGGLRQRAMIAVALSCDPRLLIADEPTTALDVTTQAQILDLLRKIQRERGMAIMLITHNLGVVAEMADDVVVMYLGRVVEEGKVDDIFHDPKHPYTKALLQSIPSIESAPRMKLPDDQRVDSPPVQPPDGLPISSPMRFLHSRPLRHGGTASRPCRRGKEGKLLPLPMTSAAEGMMKGNASVATRVLLDVKGLKKYFPIRRGILQRTIGHVKAVDDVSFFLNRGETLSLVGESGCGKTTTSRCVLRAITPTAGQVLLSDNGEMLDVATIPNHRLRSLRRQMQMIFQDPFSSLNPRMTLLDIVGEPLLVHGEGNEQDRVERVVELLRLVGLRPEYMRRYPHAFSGGQRQRIGIARALALNPRLVVADEAVSALDVSVQAQILNLLLELQERLGLTYLFVAHDLSVVKHISERVAVMYVGRIVETAPTEELFAAPKHPYTEALLSAVPKPDPRLRSERIILQGEVADPANTPSGCHFHPRCPYAQAVCREKSPVQEEIAPNHFVSCHRARELSLRGVARSVA